jgi:hypothetical protein
MSANVVAVNVNVHLFHVMGYTHHARGNFVNGCAAYETAVRLYPRDTIHYRDGTRIIARSEPGGR